MLRSLYYSLPPSFRYIARRLYYLPTDTIDSLTGKRHPMVPPKGMVYTGAGDFLVESNRRLEQFKKYCDLKPDSAFLDIGSGIGRVAIPLTEYLDENGRYEGFDVVKMGVDWCKKKITAKHPNFNFQYIPLMNDLYRSKGMDATNFKFPYPDNSFDCCIANSVFTHMLPEEVDNYMGEIARVLKPNGKALLTYFIIDDLAEANMNKHDGFKFPFDKGHYRLMDEKVQAANVAFMEDYFSNKLVKGNKLQELHRIRGFWSIGTRKTKDDDFQDVVILGREREVLS